MTLIRNRKTGKEINVPAKTADIVLNVDAFKKDWEIVTEKLPPPHEVIQFQTKKPDEVKAVERPNDELRKKSFRELQKNLEYLKEVDLKFLEGDPRKTVAKLATDELKKRENEDNSSRA